MAESQPCPEGLEELVEEARRVLGNAYAPYSGVHVAAAVRGSSGRVYVGVNVENVSLGLTICAERAAVAAAVTAGERRITGVAIVSSAPEPLPPCGACRQVLAEFADPSTPVCSASASTQTRALWRLGELLPHPFTPRQAGLQARGVEGAPQKSEACGGH